MCQRVAEVHTHVWTSSRQFRCRLRDGFGGSLLKILEGANGGFRLCGDLSEAPHPAGETNAGPDRGPARPGYRFRGGGAISDTVQPHLATRNSIKTLVACFDVSTFATQLFSNFYSLTRTNKLS